MLGTQGRAPVQNGGFEIRYLEGEKNLVADAGEGGGGKRGCHLPAKRHPRITKQFQDPRFDKEVHQHLNH